MTILVHDYGGYAFITELSRWLAREGAVVHAFNASVQTPKGLLERLPTDPVGLRFLPLRPAKPAAKGQFIARFWADRDYAAQLAAEVARLRPTVVLSANAPSTVNAALQRAAQRAGAVFIDWIQDLYGEAALRLLSRKIPVIGQVIGRWFRHLDHQVARHADGIMVIDEAFLAHAPAAPGVVPVVLPNWAPLDETPCLPKDNAWSRAQGLHDRPVFLYSGTLAMKHNPALLTALAAAVPTAEVVVVSAGAGADWLRAEVERLALPNLRVLPFQAYTDLPAVLASADVLVAVLEPDAAVFSVPSKVCTYLCAGRALLLAVPAANRAARVVVNAGAGLVVEPDDYVGFAAAGANLLTNQAKRGAMGAAGRRRAEADFSIATIGSTVQYVIATARARRR